MSLLSAEFSVTPKNACDGEAGLERKKRLTWIGKLVVHSQQTCCLVSLNAKCSSSIAGPRQIAKNLKEVKSPEIFLNVLVGIPEKNSSFGFTFHYRVTERWFNCRFQFSMDRKDILFNYNREVSKIDYKLYNILSVLICLLWSY